MTINAIQAARQALLAPIQYLELDLSVARQAQPLGITANTFYIDPGADGSAYRGALVDLIIDKTPLTAGPGFLLRQQSADVAVTNAAQPGKRLRLVYGQDVSITSWFNQSAISLQSNQSLSPVTQNFFTTSSTIGTTNIVLLTGNAIVATSAMMWSGYAGNQNWDTAQPVGQVTGIGSPAMFFAQVPLGSRHIFGDVRWSIDRWYSTVAAQWFTRTDFCTQIVSPISFRGNQQIGMEEGLAGTATPQYFGRFNYSLVP